MPLLRPDPNPKIPKEFYTMPAEFVTQLRMIYGGDARNFPLRLTAQDTENYPGGWPIIRGMNPKYFKPAPRGKPVPHGFQLVKLLRQVHKVTVSLVRGILEVTEIPGHPVTHGHARSTGIPDVDRPRRIFYVIPGSVIKNPA